MRNLTKEEIATSDAAFDEVGDRLMPALGMLDEIISECAALLSRYDEKYGVSECGDVIDAMGQANTAKRQLDGLWRSLVEVKTTAAINGVRAEVNA